MMQKMVEPEAEFSLSMAGIGLGVRCNDIALTQSLRRRYVGFPGSEKPQFYARIQIEQGSPVCASLEESIFFEDGLLRFTAPGVDGYIDDVNGRGELTISSAFPEFDIDRYLRVTIALLVFQQRGLMLHSAGIAREGRAYLFFGHSGSGKTTVARLSAGDIVLNDDLVLLLPQDGRWMVHGTPFWNPTQVRPTCQSAPLAGLFRLAQDKKVYLEKMTPGEGMAELLSCIPVISSDPGRTTELLARCKELLEHAPINRLHFLPDSSFWQVIGA